MRPVCTGLLLAMLANLSSAADVEVIVATSGPAANIGIPSDKVSFMYSFDVSPTGNWWAAEFELENSLESVHLRGSGTAPSDVIWRESSAAPGGLSGEIRRSNEARQLSVSDTGYVTGLARHRDQGIILGELVYGYDGTGLSVVAASGDAVPALPSASYGAIEAFVPDLLSPNALENGTSAFAAAINGPGVTTDNDVVTLSANGTVLGGVQTGITTYAGSPLQRVDDGQYYVSSAGDTFLFSGDTTDPGIEDDVVVFGSVGTPGTVVLQENVTMVNTANGAELFDAASRVYLAANGDWYASGDTTLSTDVLIRNGQVLVTEGETSPDGFAYEGEPIAFAADDAGNYAWIWQTSNPDPDRDTILVYNGTDVLLTEGDIFSFDQDGDGTEEPALIEHLFLDDRNLSLAGGHVYLMAEVDEPVSTALIGWTFLRVPVPTDLRCDFDGSSTCDLSDLNLMLVEGPIAGGVKVLAGVNDPFDLNGDGSINLLDLDIWLSIAAADNGFDSPYKQGDANLDGVVDGADFVLWNANKFNTSLLWNSGDFNADGVVDGADFIVWNANKFTFADFSSVPEPPARPLLILTLSSLLGLGTSRS